MGFAGAFGAELDHVEVAFDERYHAHKQQQFRPVTEQFRVEPDRLHEQVDPFLCRERLAPLDEVVHVVGGHLHGFEAVQPPRHFVLLARVGVSDTAYAPDASHEQFLVLLHDVWIDNDLTDVEIRETRLIPVEAFVQRYLYLVDDPVVPFLADLRLDQCRLVTVHIMLGEDFPYTLYT